MESIVQKPKILIVDDETDLLEVNASCFRDSDFEVQTSSNGFDALRYLAEQKFDAILTDFAMPQMDGFQFTNYVKVNDLNNKTPIFVISGNIQDHAVDLLKKIGILAYISKPYDILKVVNLIKSKIASPTKHEHYSLELSKVFEEAAKDAFLQYYSDVRIVENTISTTNVQLGTYSSTIPLFGQYCFGYNSVYCNDDMLTDICKINIVSHWQTIACVTESRRWMVLE